MYDKLIITSEVSEYALYLKLIGLRCKILAFRKTFATNGGKKFPLEITQWMKTSLEKLLSPHLAETYPFISSWHIGKNIYEKYFQHTSTARQHYVLSL